MGIPVNTDTDNKLPEPVGEEEIKYAERYKHTQAQYTKGQQELAEAKAELEALRALVKPQITITDDEKATLDELKVSNPEQWRIEMNKKESEAMANHTAAISEAQRQASAQTELQRRQQVLADFQKNNPNLVINDDVIKLDIPNRITQPLAEGKISFEQFLDDVKGYLTAGKVVGSAAQPLGQPNLKDVGGDSSVFVQNNYTDFQTEYKKLVL